MGQNRLEEIDLIERGGNYGWNTMEGFSCFSPSSNCDQDGLALPVIDYGRDEGASVTGGYVYRGRTLGELHGVYVYGDFVSRRIWGFRYIEGEAQGQTQIATCSCSIASFGEDESGELYVVGLDGPIYAFEPLPGEMPTNIEMAEQPLPAEIELQQNFPNPFNPSTTIVFSVPGVQGPVELEVFDLLGRRVRSLVADNVRSGSQSALWDGDDEDGRRVGTGVYLYRLRANGVELTRKMMLVE